MDPFLNEIRLSQAYRKYVNNRKQANTYNYN